MGSVSPGSLPGAPQLGGPATFGHEADGVPGVTPPPQRAHRAPALVQAGRAAQPTGGSPQAAPLQPVAPQQRGTWQLQRGRGGGGRGTPAGARRGPGRPPMAEHMYSATYVRVKARRNQQRNQVRAAGQGDGSWPGRD